MIQCAAHGVEAEVTHQFTTSHYQHFISGHLNVIYIVTHVHGAGMRVITDKKVSNWNPDLRR